MREGDGRGAGSEGKGGGGGEGRGAGGKERGEWREGRIKIACLCGKC